MQKSSNNAMEKIAGHAPRVPSVDADVIPMDDLSHEEEAGAHALEMHNPTVVLGESLSLRMRTKIIGV